ncbi:MAG: YkgJ family cysteine cluster protein [Vampirovibrionales bacterium]|nr:YkgJ family cysteine cluster protein [Vampirovibrionales bacterium]
MSDNTPSLAQEVQSLLKMPQSLCKQRGICCRVATFRELMDEASIRHLAETDETTLGEMARDFISIFEAFPSQVAVRELADGFVDRVRARAEEIGKDPDAVGFFGCKFVLEDGRCGVHEDRPTGCRTYPFPHERTLYHPGCGFEAQGKQNWARIKTILEGLGLDPETMQEKS